MGSGLQVAMILSLIHISESVDAFVKSDLELCRNVIDRDDVVDDAFNEIKEKLADMIYGGRCV